ncbi:hypothetical protein FJ420_17145 [Mesorhizobium sp. B3-1-3]|uniref:hypothetical protein n=1 Tax=unclassified Mesorhizobium TaxID=325217 RepID=UPI00112B3F7B|nr:MULTISPECIES: hypothetical protein [unclassified Mesorhizobium]TPI64262.1 hypothetical protein FJ424_18015 [Mesorhizobium sp. B3-1-8]TPI70258.1 hypothetical protein FJ420_17145 [Mesorhizobium sp. B3-1-3]
MKQAAIFGSIFGTVLLANSTIPASAHCQNAREVCHKVISICWSNESFRTEFRRVQGSNQIAATVNTCNDAAWNHDGKFMDNANGCNEGDWIVLGKAVLQQQDKHIDGACNQLSP